VYDNQGVLQCKCGWGTRVKMGVNSLNQVLLIDDNPLQLSVREAVLRKAGFQVSIATTAENALATLRVLRDHIGVVVTDHLMPECSGSELVRQIRASNDWLPVIVLSGLAEAEAEYEGLQVVFRAKPLPPPELIELVRSSLALAEQRRGAA
jgi:DNA-binding NtrC family response regulator